MKKILIITIFLFAGLMVILGGVKIAVQVRAQAAGSLVSIDPVTQNTAVSGTAAISVKAANITNLGSYQFTVNFDPLILQYKSSSEGGWLGSTGRTATVLPVSFDNTAGFVTLAAYSLGQTPAGPDGNGVLQNVIFDVVSAGSSDLTLSSVKLTDPLGIIMTTTVNHGSVNALAATPTPTPLPTAAPSPTLIPTPTPTPRPTPSPTLTPTPLPTLSPTPTPTPSATPGATPSPIPTPSVSPVATVEPTPAPSVSPVSTPTPAPTSSGIAQLVLSLENKAFVNEEFTVDLLLLTGTEIFGVDAKVLFDPTKLTAVKINDQHLLSVTPAADFNNGNGIVRISQVMDPGKTYQGTGIMAKIVFKSLVTGQRTLRIDYVSGATIDSNVITPQGEDILEQPKDLSFNVIDHADLAVKLTTPSKNGYDYTGTITDDQSIWISQFTTDANGTSNSIPADDSFIGLAKTFFVKVSGFLRRKIFSTINSGLNQLDAGYLKAGDLNDDTIINNADLGIMYGVWYGTGTADYNRDGEVNVFDYLLLTQNFLQTDD